jgi:hypothetical protein
MQVDFEPQLANPFGRNPSVGRDMGGLGSGGANRKRPHFEGFRRINVGYLVKRGMDRPGTYSTHSWHDNWKRPTGSIQVVGGDGFVTLVYSVRSGETDEWQQIEERVALARVPKPFGGEQTYFRCPRCSRRVATLALGRQYFRCRSCVGAAYASSQEGASDRAMRRANKLKRRLGAEPGLESWYTRPKHMRHRTFARIDARIQAAEAEVNDAHLRLLARLGRMTGNKPARRANLARHASGKGFW